VWIPGVRRAEFARTSPGQETVRLVFRHCGTGCPNPA
jgi:hypothetical protein